MSKSSYPWRKNMDNIYHTIIEHALFTVAFVWFSPMPAFINTFFLTFCSPWGRRDCTKVIFNNQDLFCLTIISFVLVALVSLWMKYAESVNFYVQEKSSELLDINKKHHENVSELATSAIRQKPCIGDSSNLREERKKINKVEKVFFPLWQMRMVLVHCELLKLFPRVHLDEAPKKQESMLHRVINPCKNTTGRFFEEGAPQRVPDDFLQGSFVSPIFRDAMEVSNGVRQGAIDWQVTSVQVDGLKRMNKYLSLKVNNEIARSKFYLTSCMEYSNTNKALVESCNHLVKEVRELNDECSRLQEEKLILCSLLKALCALYKN